MGSHTLLIKAIDSLGNVGTATANFDVVAPTPTLTTAPTFTPTVTSKP